MRYFLIFILLCSNSYAFYSFNNYTEKLISVFESINAPDSHGGGINCDQFSDDSYIDIDSFRVNTVEGWKLTQWPYNSDSKKYQILLLPGFMQTDFSYHQLLKEFNDKYKEIRVFAGVPPGYNAPAKKYFDPTFSNYIKEVERFIAKYEFDLVLGHSYMGSVLGAISEKNTYRGKMILLSPALEVSDESYSIRQLANLGDTFLEKISWEAVYYDIESGFKDYYQKSTNQELIKQTAREASKIPMKTSIKEFNSYANYLKENKNIMNKMVKSRNQIMVLRGKSDIVDISDKNKKTIKDHKNLSYKVLKNGNHMIMQEDPALLAKTIRDYLIN